jgi:hypothetical protein
MNGPARSFTFVHPKIPAYPKPRLGNIEAGFDFALVIYHNE